MNKRRINGTLVSLMGVTSGLITNVLYGILSQQHFEMVEKNDVTIILPIGHFSATEKVILIFLIFFILWLFLAFFLPSVINFIISRLPRGEVKRDYKDLQQCYKEFKDGIIELQTKFKGANNNESMNIIMFVEICSLIDEMHCMFYVYTEKNIIIRNQLFGNGYIARNKKGKNIISIYEYRAILKITEQLLYYIYAANRKENQEICDDYENSKNKCKELYSISDKING